MKYIVTLTDIEWLEVDADHCPVKTHQPKTPEEAQSIIQHYFSSSDIFDGEEERERTTDVVLRYGVKLGDDKNLLASGLVLSIKQGD